MPRHKNSCECEGCQRRRALKAEAGPEAPKEQRSGIPDKPWRSFKDAKPKVGDKILYFGGMSEEVFYTVWTIKNEENVDNYIGSLWAGPIVKPKGV